MVIGDIACAYDGDSDPVQRHVSASGMGVWGAGGPRVFPFQREADFRKYGLDTPFPGLRGHRRHPLFPLAVGIVGEAGGDRVEEALAEIGREWCRERVCQYV